MKLHEQKSTDLVVKRASSLGLLEGKAWCIVAWSRGSSQTLIHCQERLAGRHGEKRSIALCLHTFGSEKFVWKRVIMPPGM